MPCFVTSLDNIGAGRDEDQELIIRDCAGVMYGAGVESVSSGSYGEIPALTQPTMPLNIYRPWPQ